MFNSLRYRAAGLAALSALAERLASAWRRLGLVCGILVIILASQSPTFAQNSATVYVHDDDLATAERDLKRGCRIGDLPEYHEWQVTFDLTHYSPMSPAAYESLKSKLDKLPQCSHASPTASSDTPEIAGGGPSIMVSGGGASTCVFQKFTSAISLGSPDAFDPDTKQVCGGGFFGGVTVQVPLFSAPSPLATVGNPPPIQREVFGFEITFLDGTGSTELRGTPVTAFPGPSTDQYNTTDKFIGMANFTAIAPVSQSVSLLGRAGIAVIDKQVTYDCGGYCAAAGVAPYSQSQTIWQPGLVIGGAVMYTPSGSPVTFEVDISHIFTDQKNVEFGQPATISTAFNVSQGVTVVTGGVKITAFELEHMFNFRY
jgi:hypothetical protein